MKLIEVGKVANVRGLKGELKVLSYCDTPEQFEAFETVTIDNKEYTIESVRYFKGMVLLTLGGVDTVEKAQWLKNKMVYADKSYFDDLPEGRYLISDLIGCKVINLDGETVGKLNDIFQTGANDVYEVLTDENKKLLLPAVKEAVREIDIEKKEIRVKLLEGLDEI